MSHKLLRVGTNYIPVSNVERSTQWYKNMLSAEISYQDEDKTILNLANQSIFLVKSKQHESANFIDSYGNDHFSLTFEVDGIDALLALHQHFKSKEMKVGEIVDRGHAGRNFIFYDPDGNKFDVWSELSQIFKEKYFSSQ